MNGNRSIALLLLGSLGWGIGLALVPAPAQQPTPLPQIVPPNRFAYHDEQDSRRLADIRLKVVERDGRRSLEMVVAAVGPLVEPMPGFTGVRGGNRQTAEQFEGILDGNVSFAVTTRASAGSTPWFGQWRAGRRGSIPQRRLGPDGRIDFLARTPRDYPLELRIDTRRLVDGPQTTELWFDDVPRLRLTYQVAGNQVRITDFASLGHPPAEKAAPNPPREGPKEKPAPKEEPGKPLTTEAEWNARDLEGKWILYRQLVGDDEKQAKGFIPYLAGRKEFDLLEMIALHQPLYQGGIAASWALARANAPQWLRVAAWQRQMEVDHGETETGKMLTKHNPARALAWLEKYGAAAVITKGETENPELPDRAAPIQKALKVLRKMGIKPAALGNALPPLQPGEVFRHLDAPRELADLGARRRVEPGKVYRHQVLRAIKGFVQSGRYREPWLGKVLQLTRHPHPEVRQAAFLACADVGEYLDPKNSPIDAFRQVMDDPKETPAIRESALMAFSALHHPQVYVRLHELALETTHPAWPAAISKLNDLGNEFTLEHLKRLDGAKLPARNAAVLETTRAALQKWVDDPQRSRVVSQAMVELGLERAAWAEYTGSPMRLTLTPWTKTYFANQPEEAVKHLQKVKKEYQPRQPVPDAAALTRLVRGLAQDILAAPRER